MKKEHKYRGLTQEQHEELFSNYLIDSWSFSKVASFARNEKAFEMSYIYRQPFKSSASSVSGSANPPRTLRAGSHTLRSRLVP